MENINTDPRQEGQEGQGDISKGPSRRGFLKNLVAAAGGALVFPVNLLGSTLETLDGPKWTIEQIKSLLLRSSIKNAKKHSVNLHVFITDLLNQQAGNHTAGNSFFTNVDLTQVQQIISSLRSEKGVDDVVLVEGGQIQASASEIIYAMCVLAQDELSDGTLLLAKCSVPDEVPFDILSNKISEFQPLAGAETPESNPDQIEVEGLSGETITMTKEEYADYLIEVHGELTVDEWFATLVAYSGENPSLRTNDLAVIADKYLRAVFKGYKIEKYKGELIKKLNKRLKAINKDLSLDDRRTLGRYFDENNLVIERDGGLTLNVRDADDTQLGLPEPFGISARTQAKGRSQFSVSCGKKPSKRIFKNLSIY